MLMQLAMLSEPGVPLSLVGGPPPVLSSTLSSSEPQPGLVSPDPRALSRIESLGHRTLFESYSDQVSFPCIENLTLLTGLGG